MAEYGRAERQNERIVRSTILCILCHQEDLIALEYGRQNSSAWKFPIFDELKKKIGIFTAYKFRQFHFHSNY